MARAPSRQKQIAGIDRHAEMLDAAADRLDRRRNDIAPVGDRRGAEDDDELGACFEHFVDRLGERALLVRHPALGDDPGAGRRETLLRDLQGLVHHLVGEARQQRRDHADLANAIGRDADQRRLAGDRERAVARREATAKGMILTVAIISPATTGL